VLLTVGHGRLDRDGLARLLTGAGVAHLVDVRRYPGSRTNPDSTRVALEGWLPEAGIGYRWDERLGGRRRLPAGEVSRDPWWRVEQFRAYAAHTRTSEFRAGLGDLLDEAGRIAVAVMCSESVWWRCHRRLVADVATLAHHVPVRHLMHDGRSVEHPVSEGARLDGDGDLVWDRAGAPDTG
jgi:uncharacterized protein (DUF488 family)